MNIVELRYDVEKTMDEQKRQNIRHHINITPGIIHSQFVQSEGYLSITLDADLCTKDEINHLLLSKPETNLLSDRVRHYTSFNVFFQRLFKK